MNEHEQNALDSESIQRNIRHTVGISALRRIGRIVAAEQHAEAEQAAVMRWMLRYGWIVFVGILLFFAYFAGVI